MLLHLKFLLRAPSEKDMPDLVVRPPILTSGDIVLTPADRHLNVASSVVTTVLATQEWREYSGHHDPDEHPNTYGVLINTDVPVRRFSITALWDVESAQIGGRRTIRHEVQYIILNDLHDGASSDPVLWPKDALPGALAAMKAPAMDLRDSRPSSTGLRDDTVDGNLVLSRIETLLMPSIPSQNIMNYRCAPFMRHAIAATVCVRSPDVRDRLRAADVENEAGAAVDKAPDAITDTAATIIRTAVNLSADPSPTVDGDDAPPDAPHLVLFDVERFKAFETLAQSGDRQRRSIGETVTAKIKSAGGPFRNLGLLPSDWMDVLREFESTFPNFKSLADVLTRHFAVSALGDGRIYWSPILLVGPPGIGKTACVRWLAERFGLPHKVIDLASAQTGSQLSGSEAYWANAEPGDLFRLLAYEHAANPVVIIDEMDKSATAARYDPMKPLYSLLERGSARHFTDLCIRDFSIDASNVNWIATANDTHSIPQPILSRMTVIEIAAPSLDQMKIIVASIYRDMLDRETWGCRFRRGIDPGVVTRLSGMMPREVDKAIRLAIGSAASAGRTYLVPEDVAEDARRSGFGFGFVP